LISKILSLFLHVLLSQLLEFLNHKHHFAELFYSVIKQIFEIPYSFLFFVNYATLLYSSLLRSFHSTKYRRKMVQINDLASVQVWTYHFLIIPLYQKLPLAVLQKKLD